MTEIEFRDLFRRGWKAVPRYEPESLLEAPSTNKMAAFRRPFL